ncbi:MAG: DNA-processing protein DprA [Hyphomonadaceae bacterium]|nr:DNA-processing protein DprA [Hyphomonadaceae bacterium]
MTRTLSRPELIAWARLARTPRIGAVAFHALIARHKTASAALDALPRSSRTQSLIPPPAAEIERELDALHRLDARLLASCETDYPPPLAQLDAPPPLLAVRGDARLAHKPTIAIVGAREASGAGLLLAERIASDLGEAGFVIVSGMARGVDAAAHKGSLRSGAIAVLAGGLDHPYPPQNLQLHDALCERGAVVSEMPLGSAPRARDFPRRNSIISGMAQAVVIIEAALRSGSLITARAAADQGRDVMAVPGSPLDPRARGANALIKQGATLVESAEDIIAALGDAAPPLRPHSVGPLFESVSANGTTGLAGRIAKLLSPAPIHINDLARLADAPAGAVAAALMELEFDGAATSLPGGYASSASGRTPD